MLSRIKVHTTRFLKPLTKFLCSAGVKPNHLTLAGLLLGIASALMIANSKPFLGSAFILLSGFMDMLDGALARNCGKVSPLGGFLDSVFDRYVDVAIFTALGYYTKKWLVAMLAVTGALLVSYTRARAEHVIDRCDVGIGERSERLLIVVLGLLSGYIYYSLIVVAIIAHLTAVHRTVYTLKRGG